MVSKIYAFIWLMLIASAGSPIYDERLQRDDANNFRVRSFYTGFRGNHSGTALVGG